MNKIVIIEDKLTNAVRIARQLNGWIEEENLANLIEIAQIFLFKSNKEEVEAEKEKYIDRYGGLEFHVEPVCLWDFDEKLDSCMEDVEHITFFVIDYLLTEHDEDGSGGIPEYRVNIRYAKRQSENRKNRLFFYTLTGAVNFNILCGLVGAEHVLPAKYEQGIDPCLDLQHIDIFRQTIVDTIDN